MKTAIILLSEIQRHNSSVVLLQRGGAIDQTKECFKKIQDETEKQETFNQWIVEIVKRFEAKVENAETLRIILNLIEDVLYYNQSIDRKPSVDFCIQNPTRLTKEIKHSLENPVWQMF
jgi:hypothetical protein